MTWVHRMEWSADNEYADNLKKKQNESNEEADAYKITHKNPISIGRDGEKMRVRAHCIELIPDIQYNVQLYSPIMKPIN